MIIKEKVVHFYKWQLKKGTIQVIGLQGTSGGGINFSFYIDKEEITEDKDVLSKQFITELNEQNKRKRSKK